MTAELEVFVMLQIGTTSVLVEGVEVFPDHADPNQFWYLPAPVRLAQREQGPAFTLITYRPAAVEAGVEGGGFLMFETALTLDPGTEAIIKSKLSERAPGTVRLSPVPFDEGDVQCVALNAQGPAGTVAQLPEGAFCAVETILGAAVPSLFGENTAMFSLTLSAEGAKLLKEVFRAGGSPVGVIYRLKFTALRPALSVTITANLRRVYSELSVGLDAQIYWAHVGLEAAFQKLRQDQVIKIKINEFTTDEDNEEKIQRALDMFMNHILGQWFEPSLSPRDLPSPGPRPAAGGGPATAAVSARPAGTAFSTAQPRSGVSGPVAPARPVPTAAAPLTRPGAVNAAPVAAQPVAGGASGGGAVGAAGPAPAAPAATAQPANPAAPAPAAPTPAAPAPAPAPAAAVPRAPTPSAPPQAPAGVPGRAAAPSPASAGGVNPAIVSFKLRYGMQTEDKQVSFTYDRAEAVQRTYAPQGFFSTLAADLSGPPHVIDVDLSDDFFKTITVRLLGAVDFAAMGLTSIAVTIRYGRPEDEGGVQTFDRLIDADHSAPEPVKFFMNRSMDTTYAFRVEYHFAAESGWEGQSLTYVREGTSEHHTLSIDPHQFLGFLEVEIAAHDIDADVVDETRVELTRQEPDGSVLRGTRTVRPGDNATQWKVRTADRHELTYTYQLVHTMTDGSVITGEPVTTGATQLAVNDPYPSQLDIDLVPAWNPSGLRSVFVDLRYADPEADYHRDKRIELDPAQTTTQHTWIALPDREKREFSYRFTFVHSDGTSTQTDYTPTSDSLVPVRAQ
ncbi:MULTISPECIES: hypothetical protein [Streptomyces]|uniref:Uncharacterized protein n=1 Tax=Streptomyces galilaeus TaxID=33899 RepID=A0ABW9IXM5_STRGJ